MSATVSLDEARWLVQTCKESTAVYMMAENYTCMESIRRGGEWLSVPDSRAW